MGILRDFFKLLSAKLKIDFYFLIIISIFAAFLELSTVLLMVPFVSSVTDPNYVFQIKALDLLFEYFPLEVSFKGFIAILFIFSAGLSGLLRFYMIVKQSRFGADVGSELANTVFKTYLNQSYKEYLDSNSSDVVSLVSAKTTYVCNQVVLPSLRLLTSVILSFAVIIGLIFLAGIYVIYMAALFCIIYLSIVIYSNKRLRTFSDEVNVNQNATIKTLQEGAGAFREIMLDNSYLRYMRRFSSQDIKLRYARAGIQIIGGAPRFLVEAFVLIGMAVFFVFYAGNTSGALEALPIMGGILIAIQRLLPSMQMIYLSWTAIRGENKTLLSLISFIKNNSYDKNDNANRDIQIKNNLEITNLCFKYNENSNFVLKNLSLKLNLGEHIGLVGKSGQGKTTLIDVLMGLLSPQSGSLKIDGKSLPIETLRCLRTHIALVPQDVYLLDASIAENVAAGIDYKSIDLDRVNKVLKDVELTSKINLLKNGIHEIVGERGLSLSGGEKQRIGIARALYKSCRIIILDEATSALDSVSEKRIIKNIYSRYRESTVIAIAHRYTTLADCNRIYNLVNGSLIETSLQKIEDSIINSNKI